MSSGHDANGLEYAFGDYVMYDPGYMEPEIGRVAGYAGNGGVFVCYHEGCTAACTPSRYLRPATPEETEKARPGLGNHRFDARCDAEGTCPTPCHARD